MLQVLRKTSPAAHSRTRFDGVPERWPCAYCGSVHGELLQSMGLKGEKSLSSMTELQARDGIIRLGRQLVFAVCLQ